MNVRKFLMTFVVKYVVDLNSSIWFDQDHLCYCIVSYEEELTDLWFLLCDSSGESVAFVLAPHWSWPACFWICIHFVSSKLLCVLSVWVIVCVCVWVCVCVCVCVCVWERERERESAFLFWLAALVLWHLFMGRCLCSYMIFLIKYLFAVVVIVDCQSTVGVPKCLE